MLIFLCDTVRVSVILNKKKIDANMYHKTLYVLVWFVSLT